MVSDPQIGEFYWIVDPLSRLPAQGMAVKITEAESESACDTRVVLNRGPGVTSHCWASMLYETEKACLAAARVLRKR